MHTTYTFTSNLYCKCRKFIVVIYKLYLFMRKYKPRPKIFQIVRSFTGAEVAKPWDIHGRKNRVIAGYSSGESLSPRPVPAKCNEFGLIRGTATFQ